nr:unnamed protein product [Callosobruchus chinensis]
MSRQLSLAYWNACSMKTEERFKDIKAFLETKNPDIVAITETFLTKKESDESKKLEGYTLIRKDRADGDGVQGGVLFYIRCSLSETDLKVNAAEQLFVGIDAGGYKFVIGVVYHRVPKQDRYKPFVDSLEKSLQFVKKYSENIICVGDGNIDFLKPKTAATRYFQGMLDRIHFDQVIQKATHRTESSESLIDVILCKKGRISVSEVLIENPPIMKKQYHMFISCKFEILHDNNNNCLTEVTQGGQDHSNSESSPTV